jgi:DNA-3-methyladenine glycosylase II
MGLTGNQIRRSLEELARRDPALAAAIGESGMPEPRVSPPGYPTLLRTIVGQQLSVYSARATWNRLEAALGDAADPAALLALTDEALRAAGLSRQKSSYARSLAELVEAGRLDLTALPADDEDAIAQLVQVKGIGRWSAEIYLLFSEGRPDIWPAGDLAVQVAVGLIAGLPQRPSEKTVREIAEPWRPHRGAAAIFAWHHYGQRVRSKDAAPL